MSTPVKINIETEDTVAGSHWKSVEIELRKFRDRYTEDVPFLCYQLVVLAQTIKKL